MDMVASVVRNHTSCCEDACRPQCIKSGLVNVRKMSVLAMGKRFNLSKLPCESGAYPSMHVLAVCICIGSWVVDGHILVGFRQPIGGGS